MKPFYVLVSTVLVSATALTARAVAVGPQGYPEARAATVGAAPPAPEPPRDVHLAGIRLSTGPVLDR